LFGAGDYDRTNAEECLQAVEDAYEDGDLVAHELKTVRNLENRCAGLINGSGDVGDDCDEDSDCNVVDGLACVQRPGEDGSCQEPEEVQAGRPCSNPAAVCEDGFYCNGSNCVEQKNNSAPCMLSVECGEELYCLLSETSSGEGGAGGDDGGTTQSGLCVNKKNIGSACVSNEQCDEGTTCVIVGDGDGECLARVRLGRSEPICDQELS
jgi:hypothetical protein